MEATIDPSLIDNLSDDNIVDILSHLDLESICRAMVTCKRLNRIGNTIPKIKLKRRVMGMRVTKILPASGVFYLHEFNDFIVTGNKNETIFWNSDGECVRVLKPDEAEEEHWSGAMCPFDDHFAIGSNNGIIRLYSYEGECEITWMGHKATVTCLCVFGNYLVSGSWDDTIKFWDKTGVCVNTFIGHTEGVETLAVFGDFLASGSLDGQIRIWDASGNCVKTIFTFRESVDRLHSFAGFLVSTGFWENRSTMEIPNEYIMRWWDANAIEVKINREHHAWIGSVTGNDDLLITCCYRFVKFWNKDGECAWSIPHYSSPDVTYPVFFHNDMLLQSTGEEVRVWTYGEE